MFRPDSTILVTSKTYDGAQDIMKRVRFGYELCSDHIRAGCVEYNKGTIVFDNGSSIKSATTTVNTGRGMSLSLAYCDELSFVPPRIAQEFWTSLRPTLATGGKCIITSTPCNDEDTFAQIWKSANDKFDASGNEQALGKNGFASFFADWRAHPDRDDAWATEERAAVGDEKFSREHECKFISEDETLINPLHLVNMKGVDAMFMTGQVRWYKKPSPMYKYVVALDPSTGTGRDPAAIQVLELPTFVQVAEWRHNKTPPEGQVRVLMDILQALKAYGVIELYWTLENNTVGESALVCIRDTGEENFPGEFITEPGKNKRRGFTTTNTSKIAAAMDLKRMVEKNKLKLNSKPMISELKSFVSRGASFSAKPGDTDDLVMSMLFALRLVKIIATYEEDVHDAFNSSLGPAGSIEDEWAAPMPIL